MFDIPTSSASAAADDRAHPAERVGAGRYAPSPTGDLHLGNLRTALLSWLFARSTSRRFLLRVEDLDASRVRPGNAEQQLSDLTALGITFDGEPLVQSRRLAAYEEALRSLADVTYECFCSRRRSPRPYPHHTGPCRAIPGPAKI